MAHSESIKRSQDILACGLCETDAKIKVKCMDCVLYMCQKCTEKVHAKFKNADLHEIVALNDIQSHIQETDANSEFKPVKCIDHMKQLCCMYCITCDLLVSPKCIAKTHRSHLMEEIQTACKQKVEEMKKMKDQVHTKIKKFIRKINLIAEIEKSKSNEIEQKILEEEKQAREVQSKCLRLLKEHKEGVNRHAEQMSKKESELLEKDKDIETVMQHVENIQKSKNAEMFFGAVKSLQTKLESIDHQSASPESINIKSQQYVPQYTIQTNSKMVEVEIQFEIKSKYDINISSIINSITSDRYGNIWITDGCREIQQLQVNEGMKTLKSYTNFPDYPEIRCLNKNVLLTNFHQICQLADNDKPKVFKDLSPNLPYTLHVSDNDIIVGMNCVSVNDKVETPIIVRLGFDGEIIQVYKNHRRQLLTRDVVRCCTTINDDDICYIDSNFKGGLKGDVVLISNDGIIQWKYRGTSFINSIDTFFTPVEVLRTKSNNLIISDTKQHALHVVTAKGKLVTILDLTLMGLEEPGVMTIDVRGILWIGSKELNKGILSHVIFSGF